MNNRISGLHHITAIAGEAQRNYDFYTKVLGLRLVKKTVNFDDPGTYHFYYGDETGTPGSILTFFPWEGIRRGRTGTGMPTEIGYSVPGESLGFWQQRFSRFNVKQQPVTERFGEQVLPFEDPDGLLLNLVVPSGKDSRKQWITSDVKEDSASRGFHSVVLTVENLEPTAKILTDIFGYRLLSQEGSRFRFVTDAAGVANVVDIIEAPDQANGISGAGTNHHVAFRVKDEQVLMDFREKIAARGLGITPKIDRNYFFSLYFREPGGILFEIATDNPGFVTDEPVAELGKNLKLPAQYEGSRQEIEKVLPVLNQ